MTSGMFAAALEPTDEARVSERVRSKARRVLVVEDERVVALDIKKSLEDLGYEVCATARSSAEALAQTETTAPDLVLMDIRIKGSPDGIEAATELKLRHGVAIVYLTASTDETTLQRALQSQPDGYLRKPFTKANLRTALEVALQRHGVVSELRVVNDRLAVQKTEIEARACELGLLGALGDMLLLCDDAEEVLAIVSRFGRELFPEHRALLFVDGSAGQLSGTTSWKEGDLQVALDLDACRALRGGQTHRVFPGDEQLWCAHVDPSAALASICVPMVASGTPQGVLCLTYPLDARFDPAAAKVTEQLASVVAQRISLSLTNLRMMEQLKRESMLDPLSNLYNRRYLSTAFDREIRLASRGNRSIGVLMFDVDHFKAINDEFGHSAADKAICAVAGLLRERLRTSDVPARVGGDEVVVVLPDTTIDGARLVAESLRQAISELKIVHRGRTLPPLTISVGVVAYPTHGKDPDSILRAADVTLYKAKAAGRDCVVVADQSEEFTALAASSGRLALHGKSLPGAPRVPADLRPTQKP